MRTPHLALPLLMALASVAHAAPLQVSADGHEVVDAATGLTWRRCVEGMQWDGSTCSGQGMRFSFEKAKGRAQTVASESKKAWRVPTRDELLALLDRQPGTSPVATPAFPETPAAPFWSSTPYTSDGKRGVYVHFSNATEYNDYRSSAFYVRLVRDR